MAACAPSRTSRPRPASASSASSLATIARISARRGFRLDEVIALVRKIERRLETGSQVEELRIDLPDARRQRAFELIERGARLQRRDGLDEILHGLGLHEVDAPVEVGAKRELARFGQPRARAHRRVHDRARAARGSRAR